MKKMQKVNIDKKELEKFIDSIQCNFENLWKELSLWKSKWKIKNITFKKFKEYFCDNQIDVDTALKVKEVKLLKLIYNNISSSNSKFFIKIREYIINNFTEDINTCPYCGKAPLIYFENWKDKVNWYKRMFQFDHFFPKNHYQKWIINFYNLIPSCNACNHLKLDDNPLNSLKRWWKIFHPYFWWLKHDEGNIMVANDKSFDEEFSFIWSNNNILKLEHSQFFNLPQIYLNSQDTFNTFKFIQDKRSKMKAEKKNYVKNSSKTDAELKNYFLRNYSPESEKEILKFSNWKLKKDLIDNLIL